MLKTLSVTELSFYITNIFEAEELLHNIKVYGEVSNLSCVRGNFYFNLKDENSLMPCIMFGASSGSIKEGDQVLCTGSMKYYAKGGKLNFYVSSLVPYGSGILYQRFIELKNKLEIEGIFSSKYKKELPKHIKTIGVVTSQTGAVLHDIQTVCHRRNPSLNIIVYPARVQGVGAEKTIIKGIKYFDSHDVDVIIIARGGGSIEDLQPFNTEELAREIIKISKPVISAVGHETDFTICDFAASLRAATPSVAAELVTENVFDKFEKIKSQLDRIALLTFHLVENKFDKLVPLKERLSLAFDQKIGDNKHKLLSSITKLQSIAKSLYDVKEGDLKIMQEKLTILNPLAILQNGWARVSNEFGKVDSVNKVNEDERLTVEFLDGQVISKVIRIEKK